MYSPLLTDLYQLTMGYGYWKSGMYDREAVFHLTFRRGPFEGDHALAAGLEQALDYLDHFRFGTEDVRYLAGLKNGSGDLLFDESFLNMLQRLRLTVEVDAVPEGTVVLPGTPLVRVRGPLLQAQLLETALLNLIGFPSLVATKASRIVRAAGGDHVIEYGLRRAQGPDGGLTASRAAFIGGCHSTSNLLAGQLYGIPVRGTHAHSWVMGFPDELSAFEAYSRHLPGDPVLLVDTYGAVSGVRNAIAVGERLRAEGRTLAGVRLDSGDLAELSRAARKLLDEAGFHETFVVASGDLDEHEIGRLKSAGARIDQWGVGTRLVTSADQPSLGAVYKLGAIRDGDGKWQFKAKRSDDPGKTSVPGILQVRRTTDADGNWTGDFLCQHTEIDDREPDSEELVRPCFRAGKRIGNKRSAVEIRAHAARQLEAFHRAGPEYRLRSDPDRTDRKFP